MNQRIKARRRAQLERRDRKAATFISAIIEKQGVTWEGRSGRVVKSITCRDGFTVSIQASACHYCIPRSNAGPWDNFELGFPSKHPGRRIAKYGELMSQRLSTDTVYGYVPARLVQDLLRRHGGVA